jgi:GTP-binding protein Era
MNDTDRTDVSEFLALGTGLIPAAPPGFKSGFVGIVGRPNVGKSTLMNQLVGQKIAITSPIAQTTRNRLRGILTTPAAQIIFVDTPGIHKPQHQLGEVLVKNAQVAIRLVDVLLFVVDGSVAAGKGDAFIAELACHSEGPVILGLNKADQQPADFQLIDQSYAAMAQTYGWKWVKFSALSGNGLEPLQQCLIDYLEPGPYYYPPDLVTDQPERFIMGELIREQVMLLTREEVPHSTAIAIDLVEEQPTMLKAIGSAARQQIQKLIAGKVYLELFVKVQPKWRQSRNQLAELGYRVEE